MKNLTVAAASTKNYIGQADHSIGIMKRWVSMAKEEYAELILFPELNVNGHIPASVAKWPIRCTRRCSHQRPLEALLPILRAGPSSFLTGPSLRIKRASASSLHPQDGNFIKGVGPIAGI